MHESTVHTLKDEEILSRSQSDPDMFALLVERYEKAFLRKARTVLYSEEDVEDVVQETFVRIYTAGGRFAEVEGASFSSWGYRILMNAAFTRYSKRKKELGRSADLEPEHFESLPDTSDTAQVKLELSDYVLCIMSRMPESLARVLDLHFLQGLPQQEIALQEGVTVGAIKTRVHRAKSEFRALADRVSPY